MDYSNHCCPVCKNTFDNNSEVVVCPECGTPHHRECYDELGHCFYDYKHKDGFDYKAENSTENQQNNTANQQNYTHPGENNRGGGIIACQNCGTFNVSSNTVCNNCGAPLKQPQSQYNPYDRHNAERSTPPSGGNQNPQQPFPGFVFDPMGGVKADTDLGNGVTADEVSKFTKNNSPFFCRLFHQIKTIGRSRLSFVGLLFHGGWLLYRKMYKLGTIITGIMALFIITQLYIENFYSDLMESFAKVVEDMNYNTLFDSLGSFFSGLDSEDTIVMIVYAATSIGQYLVCILCALCGNRWYYKHTIKTISKIKQNPGTADSTETALKEKGGVNTALAFSLVITYYIISFLPSFF